MENINLVLNLNTLKLTRIRYYNGNVSHSAFHILRKSDVIGIEYMPGSESFHTVIHLISGQDIQVLETPEEIFKLMGKLS